ncbi:MAG TPA: TlpA disulfide reductase family protein [Tepidisphaeraceae bacterium]|nr:TlpA disulfide reductase family protein [Tepidisphaeraceae bacterium]
MNRTKAAMLISLLILAGAKNGLADPPASQPADASGLVGKPAPDFKLAGLDGKTHTLSELKGSAVVLDFWATWCIPCHQELPHLDAMYQQQSPNGLKVYAIDTNDDTTKAGKYISDNHLTLPVLLDPDTTAATAYVVDEQPETVIVGKDGVIQKVFIGFTPDTEQKLEAAVAAAMGK